MDLSENLPRSTPESQGISSSALSAFVDAVDQPALGMHSFMLVRHGYVVCEAWWSPYAVDLPHMLYSLSKSFASTAAGIAIAEGYFFLDDPVLTFFPDQRPQSVSSNLTKICVRHLLSMSTGHVEDALNGVRYGSDHRDWVTSILAQPVVHEPGTFFHYNNGATYLVSAIVQKTTACRLVDYLGPRLFDPLGIIAPTWDMSPQGIDCGGFGLSVRTEEIARFGQLYLQGGVWNGQRLISESWVREATRSQISNGEGPDDQWNQGYGYQFWRGLDNTYRADGAFGQVCIIMPDQDAVIALTCGSGDVAAIFDAAWLHLLPAMGDTPLPNDPAAQADLHLVVGNLAIGAPAGASSSPRAFELDGRQYRFSANDLGIEFIRLEIMPDSLSITINYERGAHTLNVGLSEWLAGESELPDGTPISSHKVLSRGCWTSLNTLTVSAIFVETPFIFTFEFRFEGDGLVLDVTRNVGFGQTSWPQLAAVAE